MFTSLPIANAAGSAAAGEKIWISTCAKCHGQPFLDKNAAFTDYDTTANPLSFYASDAANITKSATEGYPIPEGNSNGDHPPGVNTNIPMGSWAGKGPKRFGVGTTPTQLAIDLAAYFATFFSVPDAPTIGSAIPGDGQAVVSFNTPRSDLTVTEYTVTANPGGLTASGIASPITLTGLTNGTAYTFTVTASSNAGIGKSSAATNSARPIAAIPPNPIPAALPIATSVAVVANTPAVSIAALPVVTVAAVAEPVVLTSSAKEAADVTIESAIKAPAVNSQPAANIPEPSPAPIIPGTPEASPPVEIKPPSPPVPAPAAPTIKMARAGNASARVFFTVLPASAGISDYTVTALADGKATEITATGTKSPITIKGLSNGVTYSFTMTANIAKTKSAPSEESNSVLPLQILGD